MHFDHVRHLIGRFIAPHPAKEVWALFLSRTILNFAASFVSLYQVIFLYGQGFSVRLIVGLIGLQFLIYLILLPLAARICHRHGYEHTMLLSAPFNILCNLSLLFVPLTPWAALASMVFAAFYKLFYWPGFHACFATWSGSDEDGREISNLEVASVVMSMVGPALGGLVSLWLGFNALFIITAVIVLASFIPLLRMPSSVEFHPFSYWAAWRRLFDRRNRRHLLGTAGFAEDIIIATVWPVFVIINITNVAVVGLLASLASFVNAAITLEAGRRTDEHREQRGGLVRLGTAGKFLVYLARPWLTTGFGVFAVNLGYGLANHFLAVPFTADLYEDAKRTNPMERIIFMEMALNVGRVAVVAVLFAILSFWPDAWTAVFAIGAVVALLHFFLPTKIKKTDECVDLV